jgi:hypothetical protein
MTKRKSKSRKINTLSRCLRRYPNGNRCRLPISDQSSYYCERHAHLPQPAEAPLDLTRELTANAKKFTSARSINQFLANLLMLLAQDRITPRRGAVLAYTCNLLLRTLPAIEDDLHPDGNKNAPMTVIWDIPGRVPEPDRDPNPNPPSA